MITIEPMDKAPPWVEFIRHTAGLSLACPVPDKPIRL